MNLWLKELPNNLLYYNGKPVPAWMRFMEPGAADAVVRLEHESGGLVYTDIWRTAEVSLWAMRQKSGVQPPGFSGHNFGLSIDFAVDATLKKLGWDYNKFLDFLENRNWFCHRRDRKRGSEDWHFNYLPDGLNAALVNVSKPATWANPVEARILELYADQLKPEPKEEQLMLRELKLYSGDIDGLLGPASRRAAEQFRQKWGLPPAGQNEKYLRTLAFVTAKKQYA